jgi:hypothetical protein
LWKWSRPTARRRAIGALTAMACVAFVGYLWFPWLPLARAIVPGPSGTEAFDLAERAHVETPVSYDQTPPVGGKHAPIWQNCGFYADPIASENAVHSMEHGAVWITYRPDLPPEQVEALRRLVDTETYVIASPLPDLPTRIVASAWGRQLRLDSIDDGRLGEFVETFRLGRQAPERGGPCAGGFGEPT